MKNFFLLFVSLVIAQYIFAQNPPVANNDTFFVNKNNFVVFPVLSNDFDIDAEPLTITILVPPVNGTSRDTTNGVTYISNFNFSGGDSLVYQICDPLNLCDTATVYINVSNFDNNPVANNDSFVIGTNQLTALPVTSNDYDPDGDPLTLNIIVPPAHGTLNITGITFTYLSHQNYIGADTFVYSICDNHNLCDTATVYLTIVMVYDGPVAVDDTFIIPKNQSTALPVLSNDFDPYGDSLTISILTQTVNGTLTIVNNRVVYTPNHNYSGMDSFIYSICNDSNECDVATVYIIVSIAEFPPIANDDDLSFSDTLFSAWLNVLANDVDPQDDSLSVTEFFVIDSANELGTLMLDSLGLLFTRNAISCGTASFRYVVCNSALCDTATVNVTIICPETPFLPQGFSPDGDGKNDKLVFTGIEYFQPAALKVYNRYGNIVYQTNAYQNNWDGTYEHKPLPDGTYFYVLELSDKRKFNSYLIIQR